SGAPVAASHRRATLSSPPLRTVAPSGRKATAPTAPPWPRGPAAAGGPGGRGPHPARRRSLARPPPPPARAEGPPPHAQAGSGPARRRPEVTSHNTAALSWCVLVASSFPSGLKVADASGLACRSSLSRTSLPGPTFQSRATQSSEPVTTLVPSGLTARTHTGS